LCFIAALSALPALIFTPSRPLWPAITTTATLAEHFPTSPAILRVAEVYRTYRQRSDSLGRLRKYLPPETKVVGFIGENDSEVALWRPFGSRRVEDLSKSSDWIPPYVVTSDESMTTIFGTPVSEWVQSNHARIIATENFMTMTSRGPQNWYVISVPPSPGSAAQAATSGDGNH